MSDLCANCEQAPATTTWGAPVCQPCADWLSGLDVGLKQMEADDPELAESGRQVEDAFARLLETGSHTTPRERRERGTE